MEHITNFSQKTKQVFASKLGKRIAFGIIAFIAALLIFQAGVSVGFRKAQFARSWNDNYFENFGPRNHGIAGPRPGQFPSAHGTIGKIISVNASTIVVEGRDKTEKIISITDQTHVRKFDTEGMTTDLVPDTYVVVVGDPNDQGIISAKFIRIIPAPPERASQQ